MKTIKTIFAALLLMLTSTQLISQANDDARKYHESLKSEYPKLVHNDYEPREVQDILIDAVYRHMDTAQLAQSDTIGILLNTNKSYVITYQNFRYTYRINDDTMSFTATLTKKEKLYYRPYTALGVTVFSQSFATMVCFGSIDAPKDKKLHAVAGWAISTATGALVYRKTKNKWLSAGAAMAAGCLAGAGKEFADRYTGGTVSNKDAYATFGGAFVGALTIRFTLHN